MTDLGFVAWLRRGSMPLRLGKAWISVFIVTMVITLGWVALFGLPDFDNLAYSALPFGIATFLIVGEALRPVNSVMKAIGVVMISSSFFVLSALPSTFVAGMIIGTVRRAFS